MRIEVDQSEIEEALANYIMSQGIDVTGKSVDITMVAGRKPNGFSANIVIGEDIRTPETISTESTDKSVVEKSGTDPLFPSTNADD